MSRACKSWPLDLSIRCMWGLFGFVIVNNYHRKKYLRSCQGHKILILVLGDRNKESAFASICLNFMFCFPCFFFFPWNSKVTSLAESTRVHIFFLQGEEVNNYHMLYKCLPFMNVHNYTHSAFFLHNIRDVCHNSWNRLFFFANYIMKFFTLIIHTLIAIPAVYTQNYRNCHQYLYHPTIIFARIKFSKLKGYRCS